MRTALFVVAITATLSGMASTISAQDLIPVGTYGLIRRQPAEISHSVKAGEKECGEYFLFQPSTADPRNDGIVTFVFDARNSNGSLRVTIPITGIKRVQTRFVQGPRAPSAEIIRRQDSNKPWIEVRITEQDFEKAPCLKLAPVAL